MKPTVVLLSGGLNSTVAAARLTDNVAQHFVYVDYGHRAAQAEHRAVEQIARAFAGTLHVIQLPTCTNHNPSASGDTAAGQVSAVGHPSGRRSPGIMLAMLGLAQNLAMEVGASEIVCGASQTCNETDLQAGFGQGDPDARHVFFHAGLIAMETALPAKHRLTLDIPFIEAKRTDVIQLGLRLGAPLHMTWSCLLSGERPCERCTGCKSRAAAFALLGQDDPSMTPAR